MTLACGLHMMGISFAKENFKGTWLNRDTEGVYKFFGSTTDPALLVESAIASQTKWSRQNNRTFGARCNMD